MSINKENIVECEHCNEKYEPYAGLRLYNCKMCNIQICMFCKEWRRGHKYCVPCSEKVDKLIEMEVEESW